MKTNFPILLQLSLSLKYRLRLLRLTFPFVIMKLVILTSVLIQESIKTAIANTLYGLHVQYLATTPCSQPLRRKRSTSWSPERFDRSLILSLRVFASNAILLVIRSPTFQLFHPILHPSTPCGHYTEERRAKMDDLHSTDFLWPAEHELLHHFVSLQNEGFAWDDSEHGHFRKDFFPPIEIPIVAHTPWVERNIPIPPGIYDEVCRIIRVKMDAGVYE